VEAAGTSICLVMKAILLSAHWAGRSRRLGLEQLLADFAFCYNGWRPHMTLTVAVPDPIHAGQRWRRPPSTAKTVPPLIERHFFPETRLTGFRLAA